MPGLPDFGGHLRGAIRGFRSTTLAVAILAAGIALSLTMFCMVAGVVWKPLPFHDPDRIHMIWKTDPQVSDQFVGELAMAELDEVRSSLDGLEHIALIPAALYGNGRVLQTGTQDPIQIETCPTSADLFRVLGVAPARGRDFTGKDEASGAEPVVMLSDRLWSEQFGAKESAIQSSVTLKGVGHRIVGVMPPDFDFPAEPACGSLSRAIPAAARPGWSRWLV